MGREDLGARSKDIRRKTLDLALETGLGHLGGAFSMIEILISLYDSVLKPEDKLILSKGHACLPYYLMLREKGYNPHISGHPEIDPSNGIYCTTGSLGHGLPIGIGIALARKLKNKQGQVYVLMSDGECQEGTTWESLDIASRFNLNNLTAIVDYNKIQAIDFIEKTRPSFNLHGKFEAFNFHVSEVNGHDIQEIASALQNKTDKPYVVIAHTTKGKGVSYMENNPEWHGKKPTKERLAKAYEELA